MPENESIGSLVKRGVEQVVGQVFEGTSRLSTHLFDWRVKICFCLIS